MNITSVTSSASYTFSAGSGDEVTQLENQKASLQKELQKAYQSKEDEKTKQQKVELLQQQIQQIEAQIQQLKTKAAGQGLKTEQAAAGTNGGSGRTGIKDSGQNLPNIGEEGGKIDIKV